MLLDILVALAADEAPIQAHIVNLKIAHLEYRKVFFGRNVQVLSFLKDAFELTVQYEFVSINVA